MERERGERRLHGPPSPSGPTAVPPRLPPPLQGTAADGTPAAGTSVTQLQAATPDHTAEGVLLAQAAGLEGGVLANTAGVASATPTGSQVGCVCLARWAHAPVMQTQLSEYGLLS